MSAIWGLVSFKEKLTSKDIKSMEIPYKNRCKIDLYRNEELNLERQSAQSGSASSEAMGIAAFCGIQHITDQSVNEILPIKDIENELIFNADCILDNRQEIIDELALDSALSDGSIMYQAYLKWGIDCVHHFRGLFSLAIFDGKNETMYLVSDQTSARCLYYYVDGFNLAFSTLIEPIRNIYPQIKVNNNYLKDYLTAPGLAPNILAEESPFEGIYKIKPGSILKFTLPSESKSISEAISQLSENISQLSIEEISYWDPSRPAYNSRPDPILSCKKPEDYSKAFMDIYQACVNDAINCRGKVAVSMSSGMDSSSVAVLAAKALEKKGEQLFTYTYVPHIKPEKSKIKNNIFDETEDVNKILNMYPNMLPHFMDNQGRNCFENLDDSLNIMEIPFKAYVNLPNLREIFENASNEGCKVLLTGQCGNSTVSHGYIDDVLFDLYSGHHYIKFARYLNNYSKTIKESRRAAFSACRKSFKYCKRIINDDSFNYKPTNQFLSENILRDYPMEERYRLGGFRITQSVFTNKKLYDSFLYKSAMYTYMGELETKMGLYYGIVIRDATKDMRMLSFCYQLPYEYFAYMGIPRWLIRNGFKGLLPNELLNTWLRYGVQNSDCLSRVLRDRASLMEGFKAVTDFSEVSDSNREISIKNDVAFPYYDWINHEKLVNFVKEFSSVSSETEIINDFTLDQFTYIYIIKQYFTRLIFPKN